MTKRETKSKAHPRHAAGYRMFMSSFAEYSRENGIKIHGGRGSFARKAGEIWKDLKAKPAWHDNLDVILPQYLEGVEGAEKGLSLKARKAKIAQAIGINEFNWWGLKNLYGVWSESVFIYPDKDRLFLIDAEDVLIDISRPIDVYAMGRTFKQNVHDEILDKYSYFKLKSIKQNENGGIDIIFTLVETDVYSTHFHEKDSFQWSTAIEQQYGIKKEMIETAEKTLGKKIPTFSKALEEKKLSELDVKKIELSEKRLIELNKAMERLDSQYDRGLINKSEYKRYLKKLYEK